MVIKIYPSCKADTESYKQPLAITFEGYVVPCCHIMGVGVLEMKDRLGDKFKQLHVSNGTIEEILDSEACKLIDSIIDSDEPFMTCKHMCAVKRTAGDPNSRSPAILV